MKVRSHRGRIVISEASILDALPFLRLEAECFEMQFIKGLLYYWRPIVDYCYAFKATVKSEIIGGIIAIPTKDNRLYINSLFVAKKFRHKNIGKRLMKRILSIERFQRFVLDVKVEKQYLRIFYGQLGFREVHFKKNYYLDGTDRIIMGLRKGDK